MHEREGWAGLQRRHRIRPGDLGVASFTVVGTGYRRIEQDKPPTGGDPGTAGGAGGPGLARKGALQGGPVVMVARQERPGAWAVRPGASQPGVGRPSARSQVAAEDRQIGPGSELAEAAAAARAPAVSTRP